VQFDYILSNELTPDEYQISKFSKTGVSDHLPIGIDLLIS
jgi:endonuclease/exonuclease/phosphatase family metal-dependent hydrolase